MAFIGATNVDFNDGIRYINQKEYEKAFNEFKPLADQGHVPSQMNMGWMHSMGIGRAINKELAFKYYKEAADKGNKHAQHHLGNMYSYGDGTKKDRYRVLARESLNIKSD